MESRREESKEGIQVYGVSDPLKPIMLGNVDLQPKFSSKPLAHGMTTSMDGQRLIVRDSIDAVHVFDIRNLSAPAKVTEKHDKNFGVHLTAGSGKKVYVSGSNQFLVFNVGSSIEKIGSLDNAGGGNGPFISSDEKTVLISSGKYIRTLDISNPALPKVVAKYPMPNYAGAAVKLDKSNLIFAGLLGSLIVIDPSKAGPTKEGLIIAHQRALAEFNKSHANPNPFQRAEEAIRILDAAGMQEAVKLRAGQAADRGASNHAPWIEPDQVEVLQQRR